MSPNVASVADCARGVTMPVRDKVSAQLKTGIRPWAAQTSAAPELVTPRPLTDHLGLENLEVTGVRNHAASSLTEPNAHVTGADRTPSSVYRFYDQRGILLYVGLTARGRHRGNEHANSKSWWQYVARQEVEHFPDRNVAAKRERDLIRLHRPPYNRIHNPDHDRVRAAYEALLAAEGPPLDFDDPIHALSRLGMELPLDLIRIDEQKRHLILGTRSTHLLIARHIFEANGVPVIDSRTEKRAGMVQTCRLRGDVCELQIAVRGQRVPDIESASVRLMVAANKPARLSLRGLTIATRPLSPDLAISDRRWLAKERKTKAYKKRAGITPASEKPRPESQVSSSSRNGGRA
jgi:hypothetical protein